MSRTMASMSIKESAERSSASPTLGHDSTLNETNLDEDAATTPRVDLENAIESSLAWFRGRVQSLLRLRSDRVDDLIIKNADTKRIFLDFIQEPARRRLLVWPGDDDELHAGYDMPSVGRKKAIYFIKQRNFKVEDDGNLSGLMMGDLPRDVLEHLSTVSHEVLYPVLMAGRAKDPESMNKEISDVFHKFLSQVYLTVGQTQGKTLLPLPLRDPNQKEGAEARMFKTDKEHIHVLESCVMTWTQQIKNVLRQEPPIFIYPSNITTGTASEFSYWARRANNLLHNLVKMALSMDLPARINMQLGAQQKLRDHAKKIASALTRQKQQEVRHKVPRERTGACPARSLSAGWGLQLQM